MTHISDLSGLTDSSASKLQQAGIKSLEELAISSPSEVAAVLDIGEGKAAGMIEEASNLTTGQPAFQTGNDVQPSADYSKIDVPEEVYGWEVFVHDKNRIGWQSPAGYRVIIEGHRSRIYGSLPHEDAEKPGKITSEQVLQQRMDSPEEAVDWVRDWMIERAIDPDSDLDTYTGISDKTSEHLQIVYGVNNGRDLYQLMRRDENLLMAIINSNHYDQLKKELEEEFGKVMS